MSKKMSLAYVQDLKEAKDVDNLYQQYNQSREVLLKLRKILIGKIETNREKQLSAGSYELPAWSEMQADSIGYQRALNEVIKNLLPDPVGEEKL